MEDIFKFVPCCVVIQVREATSNDPWGPSSSLMSEIADLTYNVVAFSEIMSMVWKRLNDHGKNWRHVYKVCICVEVGNNCCVTLYLSMRMRNDVTYISVLYLNVLLTTE